LGTTSAGGDGWFGTVQVGCDYQFAGDWVIGAFGDYDFGNVHGNAPVWESYYYGDEKQKWAASAGARLGYAVMPNLLTFVSAGWRESHFDGFTLIDPYTLNPPLGTHINAHTYSGWFIGSGYEYGIKWVPGLFWKTEYRYAQYGSAALPVIVDSTGLPYGETIHAKKREQTIRSELVWRFNWR
jgi:outer membrane immunogenic protein